MKNININHLTKILAIAILFITCGCDMDLEEEVYSEDTSENFYQNEEQVMAAYALPYAFMQNLYDGGHFALQELSTDEVVAPTRNGYEDQNGAWVRLHRHTWTSNDVWILYEWQNLFQAIGYSNFFIDAIENRDLSEMDLSISPEQMIAENRMLRALNYYWALSTFGNVPIVTSIGESSPETRSREEVFAFVEQEIMESIPQLGEKGDTNWYGHFTKSAANALLAKLYMNAEVFTGTPRWQDAIDAIDNVMESNYSLDPHWSTPFLVNNESSNENIFVVPFDANNATGFNFAQQNLHEEILFNKYDVEYYGWHKYSSQESFFNLFSENDARIEQWVVGPQTFINDAGEEEPIWSWYGNEMFITPEITALQSVNTGWDEGAMNIKYEIEVGGLANMSNDMVVFRLADMMLLKAEALMRLNGGSATEEAVSLVNQVRERNFENDADALYTTSTLTLDELIDERGRELAYEMHRREDLIRFGKFNDAWWEKSASEEYRKLFPIPATVLTANPALEQNPGY
ncbi:RagB/SusD family nutrient uptake outer membrane protein [Salegentibacter mishustinae]|uniref:RagB/SusD family nutrient uptake outer membrane protein n=1 Tax=Salegentibacter mishustinae TaxID=270918 RepID=UPI001CE13FA5|nr:RagB/SusD family nutrient uptake outer membrane protein [Salegentibacter mishustinae]UBZ05579.1 RagB/SusD family nutrient uptake outer membrane protein [Salegentibacter mishustinae]